MKKNILFSWVTVILIMMSLLPTFAQQPDGPPPGAPQGPPPSGQRPQGSGRDYSSMVTSTTGVLVGSLVDENAKPVPYATLYILNAKDSTTVAYGMTDEDGRFAISGIPFGHSILKID